MPVAAIRLSAQVASSESLPFQPACRDPRRRPGLISHFYSCGVGHIPPQLLNQRINAGKPLCAPQPPAKGDPQRLAIEITTEADEVHFDGGASCREGEIFPNVDGGSVLASRRSSRQPGIDARSWQQCGEIGEVCGWKANRCPTVLAMFHRSRNGVRGSQDLSRSSGFTIAEQLPNP